MPWLMTSMHPFIRAPYSPEHLEELRERVVISAGTVSVLVLLCFCFAKDLVVILESPVASEGVRFLALAPGEYFFTTVKVAGPHTSPPLFTST